MVELSVLLPVYNGEKFLKESIESILNQTFKDFELIIIDDGSTDKTNDIIHSFSDKRIQYEKNETNLKLIKTLNKGIQLAKGKYIARIDADDICHPTRFALQLEFLKKFPQVVALGTNIRFIDEFGNYIGKGIKQPTSHHEIIWEFLKRCSIYHPTVMINKELAGEDLYYNESYIHAEDYELWQRLSKKYELANLSEYLVDYRIHNESVTATYTEDSLSSMLKSIETNSPVNLSHEVLHIYRMPWTVTTEINLKEYIKNILSELASYIQKYNVNTESKRSLIKNVFSRLFFVIFHLAKKQKRPRVDLFFYLLKNVEIKLFEIFALFYETLESFYHRFFLRWVLKRGK